MNYGKWFTLNLERSDFQHGVAVFDYRGFKYEKEGRNEEDKTHQYPIYAIMTIDGIRFCCHYALPVRQSGKTDCKDTDTPIYHQDNMILSLEVTTNNQEDGNLQHRLNEAFSAKYPREKLPKGYQYGIKFFDDFRRWTMKSIEKTESEKDITFSSLPIFRRQVMYKSESVIDDYRYFVIRKLLLDFLFDFEHSDVFQNAGAYDRVYNMLHHDPLFDAITKKAEYYYHRRVCQKMVENNEANDDLFIHQLENYSMAESKWVDCILGIGSDRLFYDSDWLTSTKKELDNIYQKKDGEYCCQDLFDFIKNNEDDEEQAYSIGDRIVLTAERAHRWYIKKYDFGGSLKLLFGERPAYLWVLICIPFLFPIARKLFCDRELTRWNGLMEMFMPRMFAAIFAAWMTVKSFSTLPAVTNSTGIEALSVLVTLVVMFIFLYSEIKRKTRFTFYDHRMAVRYKKELFQPTILRRTTCLFVIGLEYSALTSFFYGLILPNSPFWSLQNLMWTMLALFVGVFVQMIFDAKSISESF